MSVSHVHKSNTIPDTSPLSVSLQRSPHCSVGAHVVCSSAMKCPTIKSAKGKTMEKSTLAEAAAPAAESKVLYVKDSPKKEPVPVKSQDRPAGQTTVFFSTSAVHNKENNTGREQDGALEEYFEDSGYLSLQNSHIDHHGDEEEDHIAETHQWKRSTATLSSTPNLPILRFQQAVCEELTKGYKKNKSVISKIAEKYPLDRVIGGQIGLENVDVFTSLLSRDMKCILTDILALLGDLDLISCKNVSKTWKKIICEDSAAARRCRQAEQAASTLKQHESLRSCRRCGSPATHLAEAQRATCSRSSCLFDFCTSCQEPFHGSIPCRTVKPHVHFASSKETAIIPGSARSKRNVKRL
uniref:ZBR-type domain-containing protein n=1 Tax=Xiphophorus couchianus TaxID=32473 RepID=A0A3B5M950_9TELE